MEEKKDTSKKQKAYKIVKWTLRIIWIICAVFLIITFVLYCIGYNKGKKQGAVAYAETNYSQKAIDETATAYYIPTTEFETLDATNDQTWAKFGIITNSDSQIVNVKLTFSLERQSKTIFIETIMVNITDKSITCIYIQSNGKNSLENANLQDINIISQAADKKSILNNTFLSLTEAEAACDLCGLDYSIIQPLYANGGGGSSDEPEPIDTTGLKWINVELTDSNLTVDLKNKANHLYSVNYRDNTSINYTIEYQSATTARVYWLADTNIPEDSIATVGGFLSSQGFIQSLCNAGEDNIVLNQLLKSTGGFSYDTLFTPNVIYNGLNVSEQNMTITQDNTTSSLPYQINTGILYLGSNTPEADEAYNSGLQLGIQQGKQEGYNSGYNSGYNVGYTAGYDLGFNDGYISGGGSFDFSWLNNFGNGFFNIQIGGFTMGSIIIAMLSLTVFGALIKLFLGG